MEISPCFLIANITGTKMLWLGLNKAFWWTHSALPKAQVLFSPSLLILAAKAKKRTCQHVSPLPHGASLPAPSPARPPQLTDALSPFTLSGCCKRDFTSIFPPFSFALRGRLVQMQTRAAWKLRELLPPQGWGKMESDAHGYFGLEIPGRCSQRTVVANDGMEHKASNPPVPGSLLKPMLPAPQGPQQAPRDQDDAQTPLCPHFVLQSWALPAAMPAGTR